MTRCTLPTVNDISTGEVRGSGLDRVMEEALAERIIAWLEQCECKAIHPMPICFDMKEASAILEEMTK